MRLFVALFVVSAAACGGEPGPGGTGGGFGSGAGGGSAIDREELSGSRLKNRYLEGDDGSKTLYGFFDVMRSEPCSFAPAEDGKQRCLPLEGAVQLLRLGSTGYEDSACTKPLASQSNGCSAAQIAFEVTSTCPARFVVYTATAYSTAAGYFIMLGGTCTATTPSSSSAYYSVTKVDASSFVAGTFKHE